MPIRTLVTTILVALGLLLPSIAAADSEAIYRECQTGTIKGKYTQAQYAAALRDLATDVDEYTDCRDVINRARLAAAGGRARPAPGGAAPIGAESAAANVGKSAEEILEAASPAEKRQVAAAIAGAAGAPVVVGGQEVTPDVSGLSPAGAANVVPLPLIVVLVLLTAGGLAALATTVVPRVRARRTPGR